MRVWEGHFLMWLVRSLKILSFLLQGSREEINLSKQHSGKLASGDTAASEPGAAKAVEGQDGEKCMWKSTIYPEKSSFLALRFSRLSILQLTKMGKDKHRTLSKKKKKNRVRHRGGFCIGSTRVVRTKMLLYDNTFFKYIRSLKPSFL